MMELLWFLTAVSVGGIYGASLVFAYTLGCYVQYWMDNRDEM